MNHDNNQEANNLVTYFIGPETISDKKEDEPLIQLINSEGDQSTMDEKVFLNYNPESDRELSEINNQNDDFVAERKNMSQDLTAESIYEEVWNTNDQNATGVDDDNEVYSGTKDQKKEFDSISAESSDILTRN